MTKKIVFFVTFLIVAGLAFVITKEIMKVNHAEEQNIVDVPSININKDTIPEINKDTITPVLESNRATEKISLRITKLTANEDNLFSFKAIVNGKLVGPYHFELWNSAKLVQKSDNGFFFNIPEGHYKMCLVNEETGKNIVPPISVRALLNSKTETQNKLITEGDFQARMLNKNDRSLNGGKKSFVTKNFRVIVVNGTTSEGDFVVSDIQDVRDMIYTYNKWKSARVVELEYDSKGYVTLAKIEPIN